MASQPVYQPRTAFDLLKIPVLGTALRSRYGRLILQIPLVIVAVLLLIDGFYGSRFSSGDAASENLATVASWVHYRGLVVLALLLVGNLFCMGCPFTLPRTLAKRLSISGKRFPRVLRNKWLAIAGLFGVFFLYEWLDLWASPVLTAWVIVAYFVASFVLEAIFKESAFCKYVCPLGTFNFVYSTASPTQISVHNPDVCKSCAGKECINGSYATQSVILIDQIKTENTPEKSHEHNAQGVLGCGTELFAPQIKSNMDCVFCLDCVRACPHDNIGLKVRSPLRELTDPDAWRNRWDMTFLVVTLAFMGMTNAFGMVPPIFALIESMAEQLRFLANWGFSGRAIEAVILLILFGVGNILLPIAIVLIVARLTKIFISTKDTVREIAATFAPAFVPIGFGIWLSHYLFHFLIGVWTIVPVMQSFLGLPPNYGLAGLDPTSPVLGMVEIGFLLLGFLFSLVVAQRVAIRRYGRLAMPALLPWSFLFLLMILFSVWVMGLPMEMRGVELGFG